MQVLSIKVKDLIALKSIDTSTSLKTIRVPNWMLSIFDGNIADHSPGFLSITNFTDAVLYRLEQSMKIEYSILIGWVRLNNMEPRKQLERIQSIVSQRDIARVLYDNDMFKLYKKPKTADDVLYIVQFLKSYFNEELSSSFINQ